MLSWYLTHRRAPVTSSPIQPEHWGTAPLQAAWELARSGDGPGLLEVRLPEYLVRAAMDHPLPTEHGLRRAERLLVERWGRRHVLGAVEAVAKRLRTDATCTLQETDEYLREALGDALSGQLGRAESSESVRSKVAEAAIGRWSGRTPSLYVPMGLAGMQSTIRGWLRGKYHLLVGGTGGHKTTLIRTHATLAGRHFPTLAIILEDEPEDVEGRSACAEIADLTTGQLQGDRWPRAPGVEEALVAWPGAAPPKLRYVRANGYTFEQLVRTIRAEAARGLAAVFIDHIHCLRPDKRGFEFWVSVGDGLRDLAKELNLAIVCAAQFDKPSRVESGRSGRLLTMHDVRYGGALTDPARGIYILNTITVPKEQPEDATAYALWNEARSGRRIIKVTCEKNTNGPGYGKSWWLAVAPEHDRVVRELDA